MLGFNSFNSFNSLKDLPPFARGATASWLDGTILTMETQQPAARHVQLSKTCVECKRRKVRCDGNLPCSKCIYYEIPVCQFAPRKRRKRGSLR